MQPEQTPQAARENQNAGRMQLAGIVRASYDVARCPVDAAVAQGITPPPGEWTEARVFRQAQNGVEISVVSFFGEPNNLGENTEVLVQRVNGDQTDVLTRIRRQCTATIQPNANLSENLISELDAARQDYTWFALSGMEEVPENLRERLSILERGENGLMTIQYTTGSGYQMIYRPTEEITDVPNARGRKFEEVIAKRNSAEDPLVTLATVHGQTLISQS